MSTFLSGYEARAPKGLKEALKILAARPGEWKPIAGGTDLMVLLSAGKLQPGRYLDIGGLRELRGIRVTKERVTLGALTTFTEIRGHALLRREFPALCEAARKTGTLAIQNRGTIGGNIANASPAADSPPALLVYDAEIELACAYGARVIPYAGFHQGYKKMDLNPEELIAAVHLPLRRERFLHFFRKVGGREAQAISKLCFAGKARVAPDGGWSMRFAEVRVAVGSVAPVPLRCARTEEALLSGPIGERLIDAAKSAMAREISPIHDIRSTAEYRSLVALNVLERFVKECEGARARRAGG